MVVIIVYCGSIGNCKGLAVAVVVTKYEYEVLRIKVQQVVAVVAEGVLESCFLLFSSHDSVLLLACFLLVLLTYQHGRKTGSSSSSRY